MTGRSAPPHVLMTADAVGGVWRYALDLADGLAGLGVRTTLVLAGPDPTPAQTAEAEAVPGLELVAPGLPLDWTAESAAEVEAGGVMLATLADATKADLIHLNSPAFAHASRLPVPALGVAHSCVATWWRAVRGAASMPADFGWRTELTARGYESCDALIAPSRAFAQATAEAYRLAPPQVVWNGRRAPRPEPVDAPAGAFVFTAGRLWDGGKNLATLDAAAARLGLPVLAAGPVEGPHGERRGFQRLTMLGVLDEAAVAGWCAAQPIFVSAALYEPFGLAVLEAAQAGCPLVLSDIPTFRELWDGAAAFVDPADDRALAEIIRALAEDGQARAQLGAAAKARAARYTVEAMAAGVLDAYRRIAPLAFTPGEVAA